jgi:hypothetical protein
MANTVKILKRDKKISTPYKYSRNADDFLRKMMLKPERTLIETPFIIKYQL